MVYAGFRDSREPEDIPDPPPAQLAPYQHNEENMDARPDQEEMGQAINKFLERLEKQEKKGFKDLAALLSHLPKTAQGLACPGAPYLWPRLGRLVFSQHWTKVRQICSPSQSCSCTDMLRTTGNYPRISWVIPVYLVISLACQLNNSCPVEARE